MRAYTIEEFGRGAAGLSLHDKPAPKPDRHEVLIEVRARSLNYRDSLILDRTYPIAATRGVVALSDGAGEVTAVGSGVSRVAVGDRVICTYFPRWIDGGFDGVPPLELTSEQFGCTRDGMLADYVVAGEQAVVRVPDHLSFEEASTLPCAGVTAWSSLIGPRRVLPSETVLTIGSGGVALFALAFAKIFGARVICVTSSEDKVDRLRRLGADEVVCSRSTPDWDRAIRDLTGGRGAEHIVETGGVATLPRSIRSTAGGGAIALVAALAEGTFDAQLFRAPIAIRRVYVGSRARLEEMTRAIAYHGIRPVIDRVFAFSEALEAYRCFEDKQHFGKLVIAGD